MSSLRGRPALIGWRREQVKECQGGGVAEDGAGQAGNKGAEIEGCVSRKRRIVPVKSSSEHLAGIMTYLKIRVPKYLLHNW